MRGILEGWRLRENKVIYQVTLGYQHLDKSYNILQMEAYSYSYDVISLQVLITDKKNELLFKLGCLI